ncbi:ribbon-helix-helix protein, CopG family [Candidatus Poribacteria bacterium]|nr:ribbon-helix-helix protein, CopG family [Candidatus Poribacteria bacterium]
MAKLTVQFGDRINDNLEEIAKRKGITKSEVIRRALAMYMYVDDETKEGNKLTITSAEDDKVLKEIVNL